MSDLGKNNLYRNLIIGVDEPVQLQNGKMAIPIGFDNGATTPSFKSAYRAFSRGLMARGTGQKSEITTKYYEDARQIILNFFNVGKNDDYTAVFAKTTTECINILANVLIKDKSEKVLTTRMEHHANDLPWRKTSTVDYVEVDEKGRLKIDELEEYLFEHNYLDGNERLTPEELNIQIQAALSKLELTDIEADRFLRREME